ncbi:MAG TPA: SoxY-related AACIE arm protein [Burkholderiaceae bacterium]
MMRGLNLRRRRLLAAGLGMVLVRPVLATPEAMQAALRDYLGGAVPFPGKMRLEIAELVDNGNTVPVTVSVDTAMTADDHVVGIALFNQRNPQPDVARFTLGPRAGKAVVSTRIRLATSQRVTAVAKMADGSFRMVGADVIVTLAACIEEVT